MNDNLKIKGHAVFTLLRADGSIKEIKSYDNLVATVGRAAIADHLTAGSPSPTALRVDYVALGSGINAPANGDTTLQTEVFRKATASANNVDNVATITGYFFATDTNGTYKEAGLFMSATSTPGSGTLLSRVAIDITKSNVETMIVEWTVTIS